MSKALENIGVTITRWNRTAGSKMTARVTSEAMAVADALVRAETAATKLGGELQRGVTFLILTATDVDATAALLRGNDVEGSKVWSIRVSKALTVRRIITASDNGEGDFFPAPWIKSATSAAELGSWEGTDKRPGLSAIPADTRRELLDAGAGRQVWKEARDAVQATQTADATPGGVTVTEDGEPVAPNAAVSGPADNGDADDNVRYFARMIRAEWDNASDDVKADVAGWLAELIEQPVA